MFVLARDLRAWFFCFSAVNQENVFFLFLSLVIWGKDYTKGRLRLIAKINYWKQTINFWFYFDFILVCLFVFSFHKLIPFTIKWFPQTVILVKLVEHWSAEWNPLGLIPRVMGLELGIGKKILPSLCKQLDFGV